MAFNSTPFHGKKARIRKGQVKVDFSAEWSIQAQADISDRSSQGKNWKTGLPGFGSWSGSMKYMIVLGNTQQKALVDKIVTATIGSRIEDVVFLLDSDQNGLVGDIYITSLNVPSSLGDIVTGSFNFQGSGGLHPVDTLSEDNLLTEGGGVVLDEFGRTIEDE